MNMHLYILTAGRPVPDLCSKGHLAPDLSKGLSAPGFCSKGLSALLMSDLGSSTTTRCEPLALVLAEVLSVCLTAVPQ